MNESMEVIIHQSQGQYRHLISPSHDREDGVKDKSVFQRIKDYPVSQSMLKDMVETLWIVFSLMTSHKSMCLRSQLYNRFMVKKTIGKKNVLFQMYDSMFLIGIGKKKACFLPCLQSDWFSDAYASRGALAGAPLRV
jgi:hypothetical protein